MSGPRAFEDTTGIRLPSLEITLDKRIPHGAGLGGGSSDGAAALKLANDIAGSPLSTTELENLAARIGSDCAFFVRGGAARGTGRGEVLTPLPCRDFYLLLVVPSFAVHTAEAYKALKPDHLGPVSSPNEIASWLAGDCADVPHLNNSFEAALADRHPELTNIRRFLDENGALVARLSGSGSATFAIFDSEETRNRCLESLPVEWKGIPCTTHHPLELSIHRQVDDLPDGYTIDRLADSLHQWMVPFNDSIADTRRGLNDVLARGAAGEEGAFLLLASRRKTVVGMLAMLPTGMGGYVPENLLLYLGVDPQHRGRGIASQLVARAIHLAPGAIKLHLEKNNPADCLYKQLGFDHRYDEYRLGQPMPSKGSSN